MSLELYDKSFTEKLKSIFPNVVYASTDEALSSTAKHGQVKLPLLSIYRLDNPPIYEEMYNHAESFRGRMSNYDKSGFIKYMTIPVNLTYQIDIWTSSRSDLDGLYRELMFYMLRYPNIRIKLPEGELDFSTKLVDSETITDTSSFKDKGRMYRMALTYEIPTAKLFYSKSTTWKEFSEESNGIHYDNGLHIEYITIPIDLSDSD